MYRFTDHLRGDGMSVLVKNMEMPKNCWECSLSDIDDDYGRCCLYSGIACLTIGRQDNCPLIEVSPHGRLIDADALKREFPHDSDWDYPVSSNSYVNDIIDKQPTIVEAEWEE